MNFNYVIDLSMPPIGTRARDMHSEHDMQICVLSTASA